MKLTTTTVRTAKLPPGKTDHIEWDDDVPGFGLRIREGGSRRFCFQYTIGAKDRRMTLGAATPETVARARKTAGELYARTKLGQNPASDKVEAQRQASETFLPSAEEFLELKSAEYRPGSFRGIRRHLLLHAKPLHHLPVARITLRDVADLISSVTKQSGAVTANRVRSSLSVLFSWLIQNGRVPANPVVNAGKNPEKSRDRVLSPAELKLIWNNLNGDQYAAIVKLLALTGQRANEIGGLRWNEIADGQIALPAERVKNARPHIFPLSDPAKAILDQFVRDGEFVFGRDGKSGFSGWSHCKARLDKRIAESNGGKPLPDWTIHDLRRSAATHMAEIGVLPHIIEAVLNHVSGHKGGIAGIYNRAGYEKDKRDALIRWADWLTALVEGRTSNVINIQKR